MTSDGCLPKKQSQILKWVCLDCEQECIPIRSESRCICGHRLKEHDENKFQLSLLSTVQQRVSDVGTRLVIVSSFSI